MLKVSFVGYVGSDAELKEFNGKRFISFNVATSDRYKDAQGNTVTRTAWVSCLRPGESNVINYLRKGVQVYVRGDLSAKPYNGKNGLEAGLNCRVSELELLGKAADNANAQQHGTAQAPAAPAQSFPSSPQGYGSGYGYSGGGYGATPTMPGDKDGLPF